MHLRSVHEKYKYKSLNTNKDPFTLFFYNCGQAFKLKCICRPLNITVLICMQRVTVVKIQNDSSICLSKTFISSDCFRD